MSYKVLIVDDDKMNLAMAEFILKKQNYEVYTKDSGLGCLGFLDKNRPDVIILDVEMPVVNGIETLKIIHSIKALADIPVILLTAISDENTVITAGALGVVDYLKKPFTPQDLLARVEKAIRHTK